MNNEQTNNNDIFTEHKCLNHGFVRLVDYMGSDESIVQSARVSYGKGTKSISEDRTLIRYLLRHQHTTPFEMVEFKFHIKLPIFVARQWIRHRTASVNEYSGRYSVFSDEFYLPEPEVIKLQSKSNKQGRADEELSDELKKKVIDIFTNGQQNSFSDYNSLLEENLSRELARINLPLSLYTQWYWKTDLHNLLHFLKLRLDHHAQFEIRVYAEVISGIIKKIVPVTWDAFNDYVLNSLTFSKTELILFSKLFNNEFIESMFDGLDLSVYEKNEFLEKLEKLKKISGSL